MDDSAKLNKIRSIITRPFAIYPELDKVDRTIATLAVEGKTSREIAPMVGLSLSSVLGRFAKMNNKVGIPKRKLAWKLIQQIKEVLDSEYIIDS